MPGYTLLNEHVIIPSNSFRAQAGTIQQLLASVVVCLLLARPSPHDGGFLQKGTKSFGVTHSKSQLPSSHPQPSRQLETIVSLQFEQAVENVATLAVENASSAFEEYPNQGAEAAPRARVSLSGGRVPPSPLPHSDLANGAG